MRGTTNRQKDVAGMMRRRQKQSRPARPLPLPPPPKAKPPSIKKNKGE